MQGTLGQSSFVKPLSIRVGHHTSGFGNRGDVRGLAIRFEEQDNFNWDVQAALAVMDAGEGAGQHSSAALEALGAVLREAAESSESLSSLGPDVLRRVAERIGSANGSSDGAHSRQTGLTVILVGDENYYVARDGAAPAYILRGGTLVALPVGDAGSASRVTMAGRNGEDPVRVTPVQSVEPTFGSGELQDGDALIAFNYSLLSCRTEAEIARSLLHSSSPRMAAGRLAEECHQRGAQVSVAALFAGVNPATVAERPEAAAMPAPLPVAIPVAASAAAPPPAPAMFYTPGPANPGGNWVAALAGLAGACVGVAVGVLIAVSLLRPVEPARSGGDERVLLPPAGSPATSWNPYQQPAPGAGYPAGSGSGAAYTPAAPASLPPNAASRPTAPAIKPGPVSISGLPPASNSSMPPQHSMSSSAARVQLTLTLYQPSGLIVMTTNQGVLYSGDAPLGVPAGEYIAADPGAGYRTRADDPALELRILSGQQVAGVVRGEDLRKILSGAPVAAPELAPGDYKLAWWSPTDQQPATPFVNLRIGGI